MQYFHLQSQSSVEGIPSFVVSKPRLIIGRSPSCDLIIDYVGISREHAELLVTTDGLQLRDLDVHFTSTSAAAIGVGKSGGLWQDGESLA